MKKILAAILALALVFALSVSAVADVWLEAPETIQMTSKKNAYTTLQLYGATSLISTKKVKSSKTSVAKVSYISLENYEQHTEDTDWEWNDETDDYEEVPTSYDYTDSWLDIVLLLKKAGTATIKVTYDGVVYSAPITVLAYKNPVKTLKITGVEGGKNLKSKTSSSCASVSVKNKKGTKITNAKFTLQAASGFVVKYLNFYAYNDDDINYTFIRRYWRDYSSCPTSVTFNIPALTTGYVYVEFYNTTTHQYLDTSYSIIK